jgi:hypothetical protein
MRPTAIAKKVTSSQGASTSRPASGTEAASPIPVTAISIAPVAGIIIAAGAETVDHRR